MWVQTPDTHLKLSVNVFRHLTKVRGLNGQFVIIALVLVKPVLSEEIDLLKFQYNKTILHRETCVIL